MRHEVLSDPDKKEPLDQYGHAAFEQPGLVGRFGGLGADLAPWIFRVFGGVLARLRGSRRAAGRNWGGSSAGFEITLEEAYAGVDRNRDSAQ